jgi:hypothetical protein
VLKNSSRITLGFNFSSKINLHLGGVMAGIFGGAFNSDPATLRLQSPELAAVRVTTLLIQPGQKAPVTKLRAMKSVNPPCETTFQIAYTEEAILMKMTAPLPEPLDISPVVRDGNLWNNAVWEIFIANGSDTRQLVFNPITDSTFDGIIDAGGINKTWNAAWSHNDSISHGIWNAEVTIPFTTTCGKVPAQGEKLTMQVAHSRYTPGRRVTKGVDKRSPRLGSVTSAESAT